MSSGFLNPPLLKPKFDGKTWVLMTEFSYDVGGIDSGDRITVPVGFETDLASVPQSLTWLVPKWGKHGPAAIIHDYLYRTQPRSRKESDDIFYEAMRVLDTNPATAQLAYRGVRTGGWLPWKKRAKLLKGHK